MANYYSPYSALIARNLTEREKAWIHRAQESLTTWIDLKLGMNAYATYQIENNDLYVWDMDGGSLDGAVLWIQTFLKDNRPGEVAFITYAHTCSKPRPGAFGGGAVAIHCEHAYWQDITDMEDEMCRYFVENGYFDKA